MTQAVLGIRQAQRSAWISLWVGGMPTLVFAAFGELSTFGTMDAGSILSLIVLLLFLTGMLLPIREFRGGVRR